MITKRSGFNTTRPHIVPLFLLRKNEISPDNLSLAENYSDYVWNLEDSDIISNNRPQYQVFRQQLDILKREHDQETSLLIPLGTTYDNVPHLGIFNTRKLADSLGLKLDKTQQQIPDEELNRFLPLLQELRTKYEFIYIPKDIDPEEFTHLETKEIQALMGQTLNEIVENCVPAEKVGEINDNLNKFINTLSTILESYSFRTVGARQVNLRKHDVYKLIVEAFFKIRKLHKKEGAHWIEISALSSGEKQKAIIEIAYHFLNNHRGDAQQIILAIDEPEASLHMSACYDQFSKLYEISSLCKQLLFTTHWYGFIPTIEEGCVSIISKRDGSHVFDLVSAGSYREAVKQTLQSSKGKLPYDIRIKSINDFVQSVVTSILNDAPYNWLICEGSSEKLYFEHYLADIKKEKKLRIIPVGGASEIKRVYGNLQVAYEDFKKDIKGVVVLVSDTDREIVSYPTKNGLSNLQCFRIVNIDNERRTSLVQIDSNQVSPKTEIEDCLNGRLFYETLLQFTGSFPALSPILDAIQKPSEEPSYYALNLRPSDQTILEDFFDTGNNKYEFAKKYCEIDSPPSYKAPDWIIEIREIFLSNH